MKFDKTTLDSLGLIANADTLEALVSDESYDDDDDLVRHGWNYAQLSPEQWKKLFTFVAPGQSVCSWLLANIPAAGTGASGRFSLISNAEALNLVNSWDAAGARVHVEVMGEPVIDEEDKK